MVTRSGTPVVDKAMKEFFTNLMQSSMNTLQNSIGELNKNVQSNPANIDNILLQNQYFTTELHKIKEGGQQWVAVWKVV